MNTPTVVLRDLSIGYKQRQSTIVVASHINAAINRGELTCLLGPNGVGKSTLLRTLSAFQPPLQGIITLLQRPLHSYSQRELAQRLGVVLTERPDVQLMSVHELVAMGRSPYTGFWGRLTANDEAITQQAISMVGIDRLDKRQVSTLSDGERQKAMIAKALAQQTEVIYLDEPTAFLDYPSKLDMLMLLRRISQQAKKTVLLSTHDLELALQLADRLWLLDSRGLTIGTPRQLADSGVLTSFIEREGVSFQPDNLSIRVERNTLA